MKRTISFSFVAALLLAAPLAAQDTGPRGRHGGHPPDDDASYVRRMEQHQRRGLELAELASERATRADVRDFARRLADEQKQELDELRRLETRLPEKEGAAPPMQGMGRGRMAAMEARLEKASGADFDREFLQTMTHHHEMGIVMSRDPSRFTDPEVKDFAKKAAEKQQRDIEEMKRMQGAS